VESHRPKALLQRLVTFADPHLVPLLSATVVLVVGFACMFFVPYAVFMDPNGTDPGYGNNYLHDSMTLVAIAGLFAVLDVLAIRRARHLFRMRPNVVVLPDDPTYHRSILTQRISTGVVLSAVWLTLTTVSAVAEGSWLHRVISVCAAIGIAASFVVRYHRRSQATSKARVDLLVAQQRTALTSSLGVEGKS